MVRISPLQALSVFAAAGVNQAEQPKDVVRTLIAAREYPYLLSLLRKKSVGIDEIEGYLRAAEKVRALWPRNKIGDGSILVACKNFDTNWQTKYPYLLQVLFSNIELYREGVIGLLIASIFIHKVKLKRVDIVLGPVLPGSDNYQPAQYRHCFRQLSSELGEGLLEVAKECPKDERDALLSPILPGTKYFNPEEYRRLIRNKYDLQTLIKFCPEHADAIRQFNEEVQLQKLSVYAAAGLNQDERDALLSPILPGTKYFNPEEYRRLIRNKYDLLTLIELCPEHADAIRQFNDKDPSQFLFVLAATRDEQTLDLDVALKLIIVAAREYPSLFSLLPGQFVKIDEIEGYLRAAEKVRALWPRNKIGDGSILVACKNFDTNWQAKYPFLLEILFSNIEFYRECYTPKAIPTFLADEAQCSPPASTLGR